MNKTLWALIAASVLLIGASLGAAGGCRRGRETPAATQKGPGDYESAREQMVKKQIAARGVKDPAVLQALRTVPRHEFVPAEWRHLAYADQPLPIGQGQTISQPYIVAYMTEALELKRGDKVLEIGTGSGYQAAVLAEITDQVYSIEIVCALAATARQTLDRLGYQRVVAKCGDGYQGWPESAPFDAIIVTAAPDHLPQPLVAQLKEGGRLVIPVGSYDQELIRYTKTKGKLREERLLPVRFVPMTGEAEKKP